MQIYLRASLKEYNLRIYIPISGRKQIKTTRKGTPASLVLLQYIYHIYHKTHFPISLKERPMARKVRTTFVAVLALIISLACFFHQLFPQPPLLISVVDVLSPPFTLPPNNPIISQEEEVQAEEKPSDAKNTVVVIKGGDHEEEKPITRHLISTVSVLFPAWEIVVIVSPVPMDYNTGEYTCLFPNNDASPAKPSGILPFPYRATFRCDLPVSVRRRGLPFPQPILTKSSENPPERKTPATELLRWNFLVYDSFSTEKDVILFVKGLNNRQGVNRLPNEFRCVFSGGDDAVNGVRTAVTTSIQEVFRCPHPDLSAVSSSDDDKPIKISLETPDRNLVVPSVAYYSPPDKVAPDQPKSLLCACTMVYNAAKFLKEWVVYHAGIGIEKFMLYDNGSDDGLERVVGELVQQGYNVTTSFWIWPKTQEAGFSHCAVKAKDSCTWIAYIDVDEFVYSPSWINFSNPSNEMLKSLLPKKEPLHGIGTGGGGVGQLMINCYEFGPSNQTSHPVSGVMQGYNCRRKEENRHKSIVLLDAIDESLLNVIHHFKLKDGYKVNRLDSRTALVNHYKYQAWSEFKTKFRRRVSAYVVDWKVDMNLESKDRTPGLGYEAVEPQGWPQSFCEVHDNRLKNLTRRWFGVESQSGNLMHMAWQLYMKTYVQKDLRINYT